jgi:nicotinate-nucleotide adenylyltransferase
MRHIGIMGGAFNPPHTRHLMVAQAALGQFNLEKVLFVPSGNPPHKKTDLLDKELRFAMVAAAVADNPLFEASRIEVDRPGISWTIETLEELQRQYGPDVRLNFIMGEDNINSLKMYDRRADFLKLCRLLVSPRASADPALIATWKQILPEADLEVIDCPANSVSSTLIRNWVRDGQSIRYLVPAAVNDIIVREGHYLVPPVVPTPDPAAPSTGTAADSTVPATTDNSATPPSPVPPVTPSTPSAA